MWFVINEEAKNEIKIKKSNKDGFLDQEIESSSGNEEIEPDMLESSSEEGLQ